MKRHFTISLATAVLAGFLTIAAHAQTSGAPKVIANVPFAFTAGDTNLPAGKYTITVLNPSSDRKVLQIRSANGRNRAMIMTNGAKDNAADHAKIVFHRYGNRYFFAEAIMGDSTSLAALTSKTERAEKKALAVSGKMSVIVIVAE
jgi:hypothetical protein